MTAEPHYRFLVHFTVGVCLAVSAAAFPGAASAEFTCRSNADCEDAANQCDPGKKPCNDGICNPSSDDADAIGCVLIPNDGKCDDGVFCNGAETCNPNHGCNEDDPPPDCSDGVACTLDACDATTDQCRHSPRNSQCSDGLFCNGNETCDAELGCQAGKPPKCGDTVDCTSDSCDEANDTCKHVPNDSQCSNGVFCDGVEKCSVTTGCQPSPPVNCDDNVACTADRCDEDADRCRHAQNDSQCNDGQFCNGVEKCSPTGCTSLPPPDCNDNITCTTDRCVEANDACEHVAKDSLCSDGLFCDGVEKCSPTLDCQPGTPPNCNDNVTCTNDRCVEETDSCAHAPRNDKCDDGNFCDGVEICSPTLDCQAGTPPNCSDNIACTADACVEATDSCSHTTNNSLCDNAQFCDGNEICSPTQGCRPGTPPNCADSVACTTDVCNEVNDRCDRVPTDSKCSNGQFCDGNEKCSATLGCQPGTPPNCNDNISCTNDRCLETTDNCAHVPHDEQCSNGNFCDGVEKCSPTNDCQAGTPPNCGDGIVCTTDVCIEATDSCSHTTNDDLCDNDQFCDGVEVCDLLMGCHNGVAPNCADGVACTADVCVEETDSCAHTANNAPCQDSLFCNGTEVCDPLGGCTPGTTNSCDDGIVCTLDQCVEFNDTCEHIPDNNSCRDTVFCDGNEICDPLSGCKDGPARVCIDTLPCTTDTCSEGFDKCVFAPNNMLCGNNVVDVNCGEECDTGTTTGEQCNNTTDDDNDGLIDCLDPDCFNLTQPKCVACVFQPPCQPLLNDPALITYSTGRSRSVGAPGAFSFHARLMALSPVDPTAEPFLLTLANAEGEIFRAELAAYGLRQEGNRYRYVAEDLDKVRREGGIAKLSIVRRSYGGDTGYAFKVLAYGDFSRATLPDMTTHAYLGNDVGYLTATWGGEPGRWVLHQRDYE
jgi:hypothetical protein